MKQLHIIPDMERLEESYQLAGRWKAAFEYNGFFLPDVLDDDAELNRHIALYQSLPGNRENDTLHGAFFDLCINSCDKKISDISKMRMRQSMEVAKRLRVKAVIFHTNAISGFSIKGYEEYWLECYESFLKELLNEYQGISIYMENMFDDSPKLLVKLAERLKEENFGICLDIAHANLTKTSMEQWIGELAPYIRHMHINDNDGMTDLHQGVGSGRIDWKHIQYLLEKYGIDSSVLVEVASLETTETSLQYMKEKGIYPF